MNFENMQTFCIVDSAVIPHKRAMQRSNTCSKECAKKLRAFYRWQTNQRKCSYCYRPSSPQEIADYRNWRKEKGLGPKRGRPAKIAKAEAAMPAAQGFPVRYGCGHEGTEMSPSMSDPLGQIAELAKKGKPVVVEFSCLNCADAEQIHDLLLLVCYDVPKDVINSWEPANRKRIEEWASKTYCRASDNRMKVPPRPNSLDGYEIKTANIISDPPAGCKVSDLRTGKVIAQGKS